MRNPLQESNYAALLSVEWDLTDGRSTATEDIIKRTNESLRLTRCDSNWQEKQLFKHDDNPIKDAYPVRERHGVSFTEESVR